MSFFVLAAVVSVVVVLAAFFGQGILKEIIRFWNK